MVAIKSSRLLEMAHQGRPTNPQHWQISTLGLLVEAIPAPCLIMVWSSLARYLGRCDEGLRPITRRLTHQCSNLTRSASRSWRAPPRPRDTPECLHPLVCERRRLGGAHHHTCQAPPNKRRQAHYGSRSGDGLHQQTCSRYMPGGGGSGVLGFGTPSNASLLIRMKPNAFGGFGFRWRS